MSAHTPAPWRIDWNVSRLDIIAESGAVISTLRRSTKDGAPTHDDAEARDNARLIAAAPRMLDALYSALEFAEAQEDVRDGDDGHQLPNDAMVLARELREVIEKATGSNG